MKNIKKSSRKTGKIIIPKELRHIIVDTSNYKIKKSSTDILKEIRYPVPRNQ